MCGRTTLILASLVLVASAGAVPARAQAGSDSPGQKTTFKVFLQGTQVGSEQASIESTAEGWLVSATSTLVPPVSLTLRRAEVRYDAQWRPLSLLMEGQFRGTAIDLQTTFADGRASSRVLQRDGQPAEKTDTVAPDTVALPNNFYSARHLDLCPGATVLDVAGGHGIPAFYVAEQVGSGGQVLSIDLSAGQVARARSIQGSHLTWLQFECVDLRALPADLPAYDRITGNLSVMFLRPNRFEVIQGLAAHLNPGGQMVLTFPSLGTFDSLWRRVDQEMARLGLLTERRRLEAYFAERPSAEEGREWLDGAGLHRIEVAEYPLEVATGPGQELLHHPLLRGGFLDDVFECFDDQLLAERVMTQVSDDLDGVLPLIAQRCVLAGWKPVS